MFVGRKNEMKTLQAMTSNPLAQVAVLYGRRRIGKSALIREALQNTGKILFFEGLEEQSQSAQIDNFLFQLRQQISWSPPSKTPSSWRECLSLLTPILKKEKYFIVFDEFQWMANYRHTLVSDLKMIWDQYWSKSKVQGLILCGSIASFMVRDVIKSKAFYGRIQTIIHLKDLQPKDVRELLPKRSSQETLLNMMHFGGIPLYLRQAQEYLSLSDAINHLGFKPNGYLVDEYQRIFLSHFGKSQNYRRLIEYLGKHMHGVSRKKTSEDLGISVGGTLSLMLDDLESAGFISAYTPFDKPENARLRKYHLTDPYINFYFSFIKGNLKQINANTNGHSSGDLFSYIQATPKYLSWLGWAFENFCVRHPHLIAAALGFSGINYRCGPYFKAKTIDQPAMQIDLLFDRGDQTIVVCEMKYSMSPIGLSVAKETEKKVEILRSITKKTIVTVLVTNSLPSRELQKSNYFYKIIDIEALMLCAN